MSFCMAGSPINWASMFRAAIVSQGLTQDAAAREMGLDNSSLTKQLQEVPGNHLSFPRLLKLSPAVFELFMDLVLRAKCGKRVEPIDPEIDADADELARLVLVKVSTRKLRMAKAETATEPSRKRA